MNKLIAIAFAAGLGLAGATAAQAMVPAMMPAPAGSSSDVIQVAGGCGEGWHRGPYGGCRRNYAQPWRHACPRGWHPGPYGRCRAN